MAKMTEDEMYEVLRNRINAMLKDPKINALYQQQENLEMAREWITMKALATLMFSEEERVAHAEKYEAKILKNNFKLSLATAVSNI